MTKLYYTDPLQAAYMAREFGVQYEGDTKKDIEACQNLTDIAQFISGEDVEYKPRLFVHTGSHHIFEPKKGDVARVSGIIVPCRIINGSPLQVNTGTSALCKDGRVVESIIQRDNKPFFMPESE